MKKALVLSGGSIGGAFQAGAIADLLTSGQFHPDVIYGTSVGSLNGAFLIDRVGRSVTADDEINWITIGNELQQFWQKRIRSFENIGKRRSFFSLAWAIVRNQFMGLIKIDPLDKLIRDEIKPENLNRSPVKLFVCSVNVATGKAVYASPQSDLANIHDYIISSASIPIVMPTRMIKDQPFSDGGIREVAPLKQAINDGAEEIVCILCQPRELDRRGFERRNLIELSDRITAIVSNETANNDVEHCQQINELLAAVPQPVISGPLKGKRAIKLTVIRPSAPLNLDLETFTADDILRVLKVGWEASQSSRSTG